MEVGLLNIVAFVLVEGVEVFHVIVHSKLGKKFLKKSYLSDHA
jgi:hypothetical protein